MKKILPVIVMSSVLLMSHKSYAMYRQATQRFAPNFSQYGQNLAQSLYKPGGQSFPSMVRSFSSKWIPQVFKSPEQKLLQQVAQIRGSGLKNIEPLEETVINEYMQKQKNIIPGRSWWKNPEKELAQKVAVLKKGNFKNLDQIEEVLGNQYTSRGQRIAQEQQRMAEKLEKDALSRRQFFQRNYAYFMPLPFFALLADNKSKKKAEREAAYEALRNNLRNNH